MNIKLKKYENFFDQHGFLWILNENNLDNSNLNNKIISFCLNNYAYDSTKEGFLGEGSFFRAYRAKKLFSINIDNNNDIWRTFRVGLISCLKRNKVILNNGEHKIILSIYERIILEYLIMKNLNHRNIVKVFGIIEVPEYNQIVLIQEYLPKQLMYWNEQYKLYNAKNNTKNHFIYNEYTSLQIFDQLLSSIEYLHNLNIIHRDIKPENIFLTKEYDIENMILISKNEYNSFQDDDIDSLTSDDDYFDERCIWNDCPILNSINDAKKLYKNYKQNILNNYDNFQDFLINNIINKDLYDELIKIDGYKKLINNEIIIKDDFKQNNLEIIVKISDFNSSIIVNNNLIFDSVGSRLFTPPECFKLECNIKGVNAYKRDVWSLGCVLYCLLNGKTPFYGNNLKELLNSINNESKNLTFLSKNISQETKNLIINMLKINPDERLSIKEIRKELNKIIK